jgi:hypothetical protein
MRRERALKTVLVVVGLLFTAGVIPLTMFFSREPAVPMIMSIYVTLGIFLLLAVRNPAANRSLIAFGGWANLAHAGVMAAQEYRNVIERRELAGVVVFAIVGVVLVALALLGERTELVLVLYLHSLGVIPARLTFSTLGMLFRCPAADSR